METTYRQSQKLVRIAGSTCELVDSSSHCGTTAQIKPWKVIRAPSTLVHTLCCLDLWRIQISAVLPACLAKTSSSRLLSARQWLMPPPTLQHASNDAPPHHPTVCLQSRLWLKPLMQNRSGCFWHVQLSAYHCAAYSPVLPLYMYSPSAAPESPPCKCPRHTLDCTIRLHATKHTAISNMPAGCLHTCV
jgi:hypothetical protein